MAWILGVDARGAVPDCQGLRLWRAKRHLAWTSDFS